MRIQFSETELNSVAYGVQVGYQEKFSLRKSSEAVAQLPREVVESLSLGFKKRVDEALRDVVSGLGGSGLVVSHDHLRGLFQF